MVKNIRMTDENDEIDGLLDSLLDEITDVEDNGKKKEKKLTPKVIRPKSAIIKPVSLQFGSNSNNIQNINKKTDKEKEKSIQEVVLQQKSGTQKLQLKNIERLKLQSEAKRLGISLEELLERRGLSDQIKLQPKPKPIKNEDDKFKIKQIPTKPITEKFQPKPILKTDPETPKVYKASIPLSKKDEIQVNTLERVKKIKFTEKLQEDALGYSSPLRFNQKKTTSPGYVSLSDNFNLEEGKEEKTEEPKNLELEEEKPYVPNVGGIPLFVNGAGDSEPDEELIINDEGLLSKAFGIKCPECGNRFEQQDPERAECPKCRNVFWL